MFENKIKNRYSLILVLRSVNLYTSVFFSYITNYRLLSYGFRFTDCKFYIANCIFMCYGFWFVFSFSHKNLRHASTVEVFQCQEKGCCNAKCFFPSCHFLCVSENTSNKRTRKNVITSRRCCLPTCGLTS